MKKLLPILLIAILLAACTTQSTPTAPTASPAAQPTQVTLPAAWADHPVISEVLAGVKGDNTAEYIELYNPTSQPVDLQGWSVWYQLNESSEAALVYRWTEHVLLPPHGYTLLVHAGEDVGATPDAAFEQALNLAYGGLQLRQRDGAPVDSLGWGEKAPAAFTEGQPAPALKNGQILARQPGQSIGNGVDSNDNAADFAVLDTPAPQNSGAPLVPPFAPGLTLQVEAPPNAAPGSDFTYTITVENITDHELHGVTVAFSLPPEVQVTDAPAGVTVSQENAVTWEAGALPAGQRATLELPVSLPWTYFTAALRSARASAENWEGYAFAAPAFTEVAGGLIPIATARTLQDAELTIEGTATMYTGGYYAGGGNTKFYIQDESGGIQVQVFGGEGSVNVNIGARVRVHGVIGAYRGAAQIVPVTVPDDVEILAAPAENAPLAPQSATPGEAQSEDMEGRLLQVEGLITRIDEFTYSYEIDLTGADGETLTLYVDKQTNINVEAFQPGQQMRAIGILEERDGQRKLYPRTQSDLQETFPPELRLQAEAPLNAQPGDTVQVTLTAFNHLPDAAHNLHITLPLPAGLRLESIGQDGHVDESGILMWNLPELAGQGASTAVQATFSVESGVNQPIAIQGYALTADEWPQGAEGTARYIFPGRGVPVWAIQGEGTRSPYVGETLTSEGVVTGIFPGLGGFWIQSTTPDESDSTSEGLFILTGEEIPPVQAGDLVRVTGKVREPSQQTALQPASLAGVEVLAQNQPLPAPIPLNPPESETESAAYYEALEGMLVTVAEGVVEGPTSKYGETVFVLPEHAQTHLLRWHENGFAIMVDDGSSASYATLDELPYAANTGDTLRNVSGPLAYTYGRYKIEPLETPHVQAAAHALPTIAPAAEGQFSIMTWNTENFFDTRVPHPSDPPLPTRSEYERDLAKAAATIQAAGAPTIVALQEVENIGVLEDIAAQEALAGYDYQAVLIEGHDSRGIDVGYLVRGDQAEILDVQQFDAPEGLTSRPPLMLHVRIGNREVYVINNHFTSMSGGVEATEPRRNAQAAWNVQLVQQVQAQNPDAWIVVLGDLNSFYDALPLDTLRAAGLQHVFESLPEVERYTYIYQGEAQTLDHMLVTPPMWAALARVEVLHVNADYTLPNPQDTSPRRKSDHDPVVAVFEGG
ncbi:MAG: hypothetical protein Fur0018_08190 [Anaerolineales bacterium]